MTRPEFAAQMAKLAAAYRKDIAGATAEVYYEALGALAPADVAAAVSWAIRTSKFLPAPSELLDRAKHERVSRLKALPPAPAEAIPEWVTEPADGETLDVKALLADLVPKLTLADQRVKALRPERPTGDLWSGERDPEDIAARVETARAMLDRCRAWNGEGGA